MVPPPGGSGDALAEFLEAACVPVNADHTSGTLERASELLEAHPDLADRSLHAAAVLGDAAAVQHHLERDPAGATAPGGPRRWEPLVHLCFSRFLRLDRSRSDGFLRAATALLAAGADANAGWYSPDHDPPEFESVLYGAAGVAHHAGLTRLLLERGADPNDGETTYHTPEGYDNAALQVLVEVGRPGPDSLAVMLVRKHDWHDRAGVEWLLEHGADPNHRSPWGRTPFHHAVLRDNDVEIIETVLAHGGDPTLAAPEGPLAGRSAAGLAACRGRGDLLALFAARGFALRLDGVETLLAACARDDTDEVNRLAATAPETAGVVVAEGGRVLAEFAANGNAAGVRHLLDLGISPDARWTEGDGYWGLAPRSTALHAAAWRMEHAVVELLLARGASPDARDDRGRTPLALAVKACVDSYWTEWRAPDSVRLLLAAGASVEGIPVPSGYDEVDRLLAADAGPS